MLLASVGWVVCSWVECQPLFFVVCFVSRCCVYVIIIFVLFGCVLGFSGCTLGVVRIGDWLVLVLGLFSVLVLVWFVV